MQVGLSPGHILLDGDPAPPPPKGHSPPNFRPISAVAKWLDGSRCHLVGRLGRPRPKQHCVRPGPNSPPQKGGRAPQFLAHAYCGQTAGWIKRPLGIEGALGPGHIVPDGEPAPPHPKRGHSHPIFSPCLPWPNGWMDQDDTWYGDWPRPRPHCVR